MNEGIKGVLLYVLGALFLALAFGSACEGSSGGADMWDNPGWRYDR